MITELLLALATAGIPHNIDCGLADISQFRSQLVSTRSLEDVAKTKIKPGTDLGTKMFVKKTMLVFSADWCQPCRRFEAESMQFLRDNGVRLRKVDVEKNPNLKEKLGVESIPYIVVVKDNKVLWAGEGSLGKEQLLKQYKLAKPSKPKRKKLIYDI